MRRSCGAPGAQAIGRMSTADGFVVRRWRGRIRVERLLWPEMLGVGTVVNLLATMLAVTALIQGGPGWLAVLLHFAPMPYNVLLLVAVWRAADRTVFAFVVALAWLVVMTLV